MLTCRGSTASCACLTKPTSLRSPTFESAHVSIHILVAHLGVCCILQGNGEPVSGLPSPHLLLCVLQDNAKTMKVQLDAQNKAVDQLKGNTRMLESKLAEAKSKKDTLKARAKSAATSRQIQEMIQGLNTSNAATAFERMEEKVMALEGESEAAMQVKGQSVL